MLIDITAAMKENPNLPVMAIVRPQSEWCLNSEPVFLLVPLQQQTDCRAVTPPLHL